MEYGPGEWSVASALHGSATTLLFLSTIALWTVVGLIMGGQINTTESGVAKVKFSDTLQFDFDGYTTGVSVGPLGAYNFSSGLTISAVRVDNQVTLQSLFTSGEQFNASVPFTQSELPTSLRPSSLLGFRIPVTDDGTGVDGELLISPTGVLQVRQVGGPLFSGNNTLSVLAFSVSYIL